MANFEPVLGAFLLHKHKDTDITTFGVLDARYLKLDATNDPITSNLTISSGGITVTGTSNFNSTTRVANDISLTFLDATDTNNNSLKTGSDGTFIFDVGSGNSTRIKGGDALGAETLDFTDSSFNTEWIVDTLGNVKHNGYLRVGSTSAPSITSSGYLQVDGNSTIGGYLRVGLAGTAPSNTTAGDLTFINAYIGSGEDVKLYASASNTLRTDDMFQVIDGASALNENTTTAGIHIGQAGGTHRILLSRGTAADNWEIDNSSGTLRFFVPGSVKANLDTSGNLEVLGYLRVGSLTNPSNTTAGDLTVTRLSVGNGTFQTSNGLIMNVIGTLTNTASGAHVYFATSPTFAPTSNSSSEFRTFYQNAVIAPSPGVTMNTVTSIAFDTRHRGDSLVSTLNGISGTALVSDGSSPSSVSATLVNGANVALVGRPSGTGTITITTGNLFNASLTSLSNFITATTITGFKLNNPGANAITTLIGLDIEPLTRGNTSSIGARIGWPGVGTGQTVEIGNTTDATAIQITSASVAMGNQTATTTNAFGLQIGTVTYTSTTNTRTITNSAAIYIQAAPVASTNVTVTNGPYSIWVDAGTSRFDGNLDFSPSDSTNIVLGTGTGTKIGTATTQKLGFFNATPIVQPSAYTQTYSTADKTHANPTAATLTMADGAGTNDNTIGAITADASVVAAFQEVVDEVNKLIADVADAKQLANSLIDDLQSLGLVA